MFKSQFTPHDSSRYGLSCPEESLTKQSEKDFCDINLIMKKFAKTGDLSVFNRRVPSYGDVYDAPDYVEAFNRVTAVNELFASFDARTRERFGNSPKVFLDYASNPANINQLVELGLLERVEPVTKTATPVENPTDS